MTSEQRAEPFRVLRLPRVGRCYYLEERNTGEVCDIPHRDDERAMAYLLAAAPVMRACLMALRAEIEKDGAAMAKYIAAIDRALSCAEAPELPEELRKPTMGDVII